MKKDLLFFILVIAVCSAGFFLTKRNTDEILVAKKVETVKSSAKVANQNSSSNKKGSESTKKFSLNVTSNFDDSYESVIENRVPTTDQDIDEVDFLEAPEKSSSVSPETWEEAFGLWKLHIIENRTIFTDLTHVETTAKCSLGLANEKYVPIAVDSSIKVELDNMNLVIKTSNSEQSIVLKRLRDPNETIEHTKKLVDFCEKTATKIVN